MICLEEETKLTSWSASAIKTKCVYGQKTRKGGKNGSEFTKHKRE